MKPWKRESAKRWLRNGGREENSETPIATDKNQHAAKIGKLHDLSQNARVLAEYDKRIQAEQELATLYGRWGASSPCNAGSHCTPS